MKLNSRNGYKIFLASTAATFFAAAMIFGTPVEVETVSPASDEKGYVVGARKVFDYPNVIDLVSDRRNLSERDTIELPPGFYIERAEWIVHRKKHTVNYGATVRQAASVAIDQSSLISARNAKEQAHGIFSGKAKIEALASLDQSFDKLGHSFVLSAGSHPRVNYRGWADGRRFSSKDGVIVASLKVTARYVGTTSTVDATLAKLASELGRADAEAIATLAVELEKSALPKAASGPSKATPSP